MYSPTGNLNTSLNMISQAEDANLSNAIDWNLIGKLDPKQIKDKKEMEKINLLIKSITKANIPDDPEIFSNNSLTPRLIQLLQISIQYLVSLQKKTSKVLNEKAEQYNKLSQKNKKIESSYRQSLQIIDQLRIPREICPICGKKFKIGGYLDQHFRLKHPNLIEPWIQIRSKSLSNSQQDEQMLMNEIAALRQPKGQKNTTNSNLNKSLEIEQGDIVQFSPKQAKANPFSEQRAKDNLLNTNQIDQMVDEISKRVAETIHSNQTVNAQSNSKSKEDEYDGILKKPSSRVMFDQSAIQKQYQNDKPAKPKNSNVDDLDDYLMESGEISKSNDKSFPNQSQLDSKEPQTTDYSSEQSYESGEYIPVQSTKKSISKSKKKVVTNQKRNNQKSNAGKMVAQPLKEETVDLYTKPQTNSSNTQLESLPKPPKREILSNSDNSSSGGFTKSTDDFNDYIPNSNSQNPKEDFQYEDEYNQNNRETEFTNADLDALIPESSSIIEERMLEEKNRSSPNKSPTHLFGDNFLSSFKSSGKSNTFEEFNDTEENQRKIANNDFYVDDSFNSPGHNDYMDQMTYDNVPPQYTHYTPDELEVLMAEDSALENAISQSPKNTKISPKHDYNNEETKFNDTVDEELENLRKMNANQPTSPYHSPPVSTNKAPMTIAEAKKMARKKKATPTVTSIGGIPFTDSELAGFL